MRPHSLAIAAVATMVTWLLAYTTAEARCSYFARFPGAIGAQTYMLATAVADTVKAIPYPSSPYSRLVVPAQVMKVGAITGHESDKLTRGLRASGGTAVFVRYHVGAHCGPVPALDGMLDSAGVNGLFVGIPRAESVWVGGRPTFDIHRAVHYPLPQRLEAPSGHLVFTSPSDQPTMTAPELFTMYEALWADSVRLDDSTVEQRLTQWIAKNPAAALKRPAQEVASGLLSALAEARVATFPIPYGGTFRVSVVVPDADSMVMYGQMFRRARVWMGDSKRDSVTGIFISQTFHTFAVDMQLAPVATGFERLTMQIFPCAPIVTIVNALPIVPAADSTWQGEMSPMGFLECAPEGTPLRELTKPGAVRGRDPGTALVTYRRHADGRVTFDGRTRGPGRLQILVRGERISTAGYGPPWQ